MWCLGLVSKTVGCGWGCWAFWAWRIRLCAAAEGAGVSVATVDAYQGAEKPIIILSPVRTSPRAAASVATAVAAAGAFVDDSQRLNVALTRAKHHLFIVCHARALATYPVWRRIIAAAVEASAVCGGSGSNSIGGGGAAAPVLSASFRSAAGSLLEPMAPSF